LGGLHPNFVNKVEGQDELQALGEAYGEFITRQHAAKKS
jgi:hypothetical protein